MNLDLSTFLHENIDESGISKDISIDLAEAEENLKDVKGGYYKILQLHTALNDLLLEHNYGLPQIKFDPQKESDAYEIISDLFYSAEAKHCINISLKSATLLDEENLFGLSMDDFDIDPGQIKFLHEKIQLVLIPEVERRLKAACLELYKSFTVSSQESEGLSLAKAAKLPYNIKSEQDKLADMKKKLDSEENKYDYLFEENLATISKIVKKMEEQFSNNDQVQHLEVDKIKADWYATKCDLYLYKARVMKNRIFFETYSPECIEALDKVHSHLAKKVENTRSSILEMAERLKQYESLGDTFPRLLKEYNQLTLDIDNKKWALAELRDNHR